MNKIKKLFKNRIFLCLFTALLVGSITVKAATYFPSNDVTYDNSESGLSSTDVQGAIDELYSACFPPEPEIPAGEQLLNKTTVVTSGDGLYKDEYEEGRYIYKGANPNNYITFNNEEAGWRIISIENDGTIKIMYNKYAGSMAWDTSGSNNWTRPATINTYLNETYFKSLNQEAQKQVVSHNFNIGGLTSFNNDLPTILSNEKNTKWNGKIGLITVSEYLRSNTQSSMCSTISSNNNYSNECYKTTWMYTASNYWTMTKDSLYNENETVYLKDITYNITVFNVKSNGDIMDAKYAKPVLFLSSEIKIIGGTGTQSDPYQIK